MSTTWGRFLDNAFSTACYESCVPTARICDQLVLVEHQPLKKKKSLNIHIWLPRDCVFTILPTIHQVINIRRTLLL